MTTLRCVYFCEIVIKTQKNECTANEYHNSLSSKIYTYITLFWSGQVVYREYRYDVVDGLSFADVVCPICVNQLYVMEYILSCVRCCSCRSLMALTLSAACLQLCCCLLVSGASPGDDYSPPAPLTQIQYVTCFLLLVVSWWTGKWLAFSARVIPVIIQTVLQLVEFWRSHSSSKY